MRPVESWLEEYGESHRNSVNIGIHKICVPLIVFSILGMLWNLKISDFVILNGSFCLVTISLFFYALLSWKFFLGMLVQSSLMICVLLAMEQNHLPIFSLSLGIFVVSWIFQFVGHKIEGKKPSFFQDILFLMIGPLWTMNFFYKRLGWA